MDSLKGTAATKRFLDFYEQDLEIISQNGPLLTLEVSPYNNQKKTTALWVNELFFPEIGGDEKTGMGFTVDEALDNPNSSLTAHVKEGSDLDFLLKTQVMSNFNGHIPLIPVYDLRTLITHDDGLYDVNFCWAASMFPVVVPNAYGLSAGKSLFDLLELTIKNESAEAVLAIGERARDYAGVAIDRLGLPFTASRPKGSKIKRDVIEIGCISSYGIEAGLDDNENSVEQKPHVVDVFFMNSLYEKKVAILDDLDATGNTMKSFVDEVRIYGGKPIGITVDHLAYLPKEIVVVQDIPVNSIFVEYIPGKPVFTDYIKQLPLNIK